MRCGRLARWHVWETLLTCTFGCISSAPLGGFPNAADIDGRRLNWLERRFGTAFVYSYPAMVDFSCVEALSACSMASNSRHFAA